MCFMCGNCHAKGPAHDRMVAAILEESKRKFLQFIGQLLNGEEKLAIPNVKLPWPDIRGILSSNPIRSLDDQDYDC